MMLYDAAEFGGRDRADFVQALQAEGIPCTSGYERPLTDEGALTTVAAQYRHLIQRHPCPNIESLSARSVWLYQSMLLGSRQDMDDIVAAVQKNGLDLTGSLVPFEEIHAGGPPRCTSSPA